jgi:hypothetical protein
MNSTRRPICSQCWKHGKNDARPFIGANGGLAMGRESDARRTETPDSGAGSRITAIPWASFSVRPLASVRRGTSLGIDP